MCTCYIIDLDEVQCKKVIIDSLLVYFHRKGNLSSLMYVVKSKTINCLLS